MMPAAPPIGVLLFNLGGPDDLASVEPFLINLFSDREIIELPLGAITQPVFARAIAKVRGPSVRRSYALIGGGSPQLRITREQATALEQRLNSGVPDCTSSDRGGTRHAAEPPSGHERRFRVFIAMRYWHPSTEEALAAMKAEGIERAVTLTLFPHWSKATTGSSLGELRRVLALPRWRECGISFSHVDRYPDDALYLDAFAATIRSALEEFPAETRDGVVVLFSAHGLPQKFVDEGDPYVGEIEATRQGLLERLALPNRQLLGYQSRTGPVKWIGPGTDERIEELGREGVKDVLVVPLSFVSDHIETLYEVDILFADFARRSGIVNYRRPKALNTDPRFIEALARLVERHLEAQP